MKSAKTIVLALLATATLTLATPDNFERWMEQVYKIAPRYGLTLHPKDEMLNAAEREWFHLYFWQAGKTPTEAVTETVRHDREHRL